MRFNFRIKVRGWTLFGMLAKTQTCKGFTSLIKNVGSVLNNVHYAMWDLEGASLKNVILELTYIQQKYDLGEIWITGEHQKLKSYRAWSFKPISFRELIAIINDTQYVDYLFFKYTVIRGKATLRYSQKVNRPPQKILYRIEGKVYPLPETMERVIYDTGIVKESKDFIVEI